MAASSEDGLLVPSVEGVVVPSDDEVADDVVVTAVSSAKDKTSLARTGVGSPPLHFQGYRRGRELGSGGYGKVYACSHLAQASRYAAKAVDLRRIQLSGNAARQHTLLSREVEILKALPQHPNIVQMFDAFEEGDWFFLILELVPGGDMFTVLTSRDPPKLSEHEAGFILRQVVDGLDFLHGQGIIHRDLKLENVLVASQRRERANVLYTVKITDFGLSKSIGRGMSDARSSVGTRPYAAPEVGAKNVYDYTSDLWCLGIFLYVLLAGRFPFDRIPEKQEEVDNIVGKLRKCEVAKQIASRLMRLQSTERLTLREVRESAWLQQIGCHEVLERNAKRPRTTGTEVIQPAFVSLVDAASGGAGPAQVTLDEAPAKVDDLASAPTRTESSLLKEEVPRVLVANHFVVEVEREERADVLVRVLEIYDFGQVVVFVASNHQAVELEKVLISKGFSPLAIHSLLAESVCRKRYQSFMDLEHRVLVTSDPSVRGLDAANVHMLINFDMPVSTVHYVERLGKKKEFGAGGSVLNFVASVSDTAVLKDVQLEFGVNLEQLDMTGQQQRPLTR